MAKFLHVSDLHLSNRSSSEEDYCFGVLAETFAVAAREKVDLVLLAGDVFDDAVCFAAMSKHLDDQARVLSAHIPVLFLPGNHEHLRGNGKALNGSAFERITFCPQIPFSHLRFPELQLDVVMIPHQSEYATYKDWTVPAKQERVRVVAAHASVPLVLEYAPDAEENAAALDADLFLSLDADYAALGHIHARRLHREKKCWLAYPGSARVWRKDEAGPRGCYVVDYQREVSAHFVPLRSAGEFRRLDFALGMDDEAVQLHKIRSVAGLKDHLCLHLSGFAEDSTELGLRVEELRSQLLPLVRIVDVDSSEVVVAEGLRNHPLARRFLEEWKTFEAGLKDDEERAIWLLARQEGLKAILESMGGG